MNNNLAHLKLAVEAIYLFRHGSHVSRRFSGYSESCVLAAQLTNDPELKKRLLDSQNSPPDYSFTGSKEQMDSFHQFALSQIERTKDDESVLWSQLADNIANLKQFVTEPDSLRAESWQACRMLREALQSVEDGTEVQYFAPLSIAVEAVLCSFERADINKCDDMGRDSTYLLLLRELTNCRIRLLGTMAAPVADCFMRMAKCLKSTIPYTHKELARQLLWRALNIRKYVFGECSTQVGLVWYHLALCTSYKNPDEQLYAATRAVELLGESHPDKAHDALKWCADALKSMEESYAEFPLKQKNVDK